MNEKTPPTADQASSQKVDKTAQVNDDTKAEEKTKAPIGNYWRILSYGSGGEHALILGAFFASAASGVAMPLMNIVFGNLTGTFNSYATGDIQDTGDFNSTLNRYSLYIFLLFIGKFVLCYISMFCFRVVSLRVSAALRLSYMESLFRQTVAKLDVVSAGTVSNTITSSANTIQVSISDRLAYFFQSVSLIIAAYIIAFVYSWKLTLISSAQLLFVLVVYSITTPAILKSLQRVEKTDAKHASVASEIFSSIRTVFALGAELSLSKKYYSLVDESGRYGERLSPFIGFQLMPMFFAMFSTFALAFWAGLKFYYEGSIANVNTVIIAFFSVLIVVSILGQVVQPVMNIMKAVTASVPFFDIIDSERTSVDGKRAPEVSAHEDLELKGVTFAYPTRPGVQVLDNFNVRFQKGKTTALVGPSGSGKSTIVGLLERWYSLDDPQTRPNTSTANSEKDPAAKAVDDNEQETVQNQGTISCGQHNIDSLALKWWRSQIGLVQQEPFLFNDTILNNVAFGLLGTEWEDYSEDKKLELVKEACKESYADEFVEKLPQGYSTKVGESGIKLSGGQRQRLAIARSIVRRPAILILDEATSSIDIRSEAVVQKALDRVSRERTTIVIAHRLATIRKADHIVVLRSGTKVEEGTHEELLLNEDGLYSGLVRAQQIQEEATDEPAASSTSSAPADLMRTHSTAARSVAETRHEGESNSPTYKKRGFLRSVGFLLVEQRKKWIYMLLILIGAMGAGGSFALQSWFFAKLIEVFTFVGQRLLNARDHWSLMFFILALANAAFYGAIGYAGGMLSASTSAMARRDYFANTIRQPVPYFDGEDNSSGDIMSRLSSDPKQIGELMGLNGAFPLISIFNLLSCMIISFYFGWKLTIVIVFAAVPLLLVCQFIKFNNEFKFEEMNANVFSSSSAFATESIAAFRTVSSLTMEDTIIAKYSKLLSDQVAASTKRASYAMLVNAFCDSVELAAMALTFWYGGRLLGSREYEPTQFFVIYVAIIQGSIAAGQFFSAAPSIVTATASANRILRLRTLGLNNSSTQQDLPPSTSNLGSSIELDRVSFQYPTRDVPTFQNLSLSIPAGSFAAFVGPSGCGKTSVISLLERFYEPLSGTVKLDGADVRDSSLPTYRRSLSLVAQEPKLFSGTIRENLVLGIEDQDIPDDRVHQACRDAEIHDFIISLPDGYGTELGINTATALSGGQKQRLCLARALLRRPKLLLLDEATSSLDSQSERLVQQAIERLAGQRSMTVVAVAHRLATIQKADVIFVFGESEVGVGAKILERGSHSELLRKRGAYWQMCQAQALDR